MAGLLALVMLVVTVAQSEPVAIIHAFSDGLNGVRAANPDVHLSVGRDPAVPDPVLIVDYPLPSTDPAARDVRCASENSNWTAGRGISFQIKPDHDARISVSFFDRNRVAYTSWRDLKGAVWQTVWIPFDEMRPNPFFQLPNVNKNAPLDVSEVRDIMFAPQDPASGRLTIGRFVVVR
jgi:hypothetical protein